MQSWQKHWLKFVVGTTINAGVYISYRLYMHNQKKKKETEKKINKELTIIKMSPKGSLEEQLIDIKNKNRKSSKPKLKIYDNKPEK